ncbi:hypothetical protein AOC36_00170 [Erysipelothrix larvae]|uniref:QueT transporter family protein n=1 Tax=Erysipelothrix larvae TaxID=1514105 RepID=A0A109UGD5_9FIRM|nr:QueT transporter family protein [Erysipelothrix larvae]AMC92462.1 hypothetical protein AOC36_00170 [Erysipelothrix larvae]
MKLFDRIKNLDITTRGLVIQGMIAALYVALTFGLYNLSYGPLQFRVSEFLLILVLVNPKNAVGIIAGTFIANLIGAYGVLDMVVGTLATTLVCLLMILKQPRLLSYVWPTIINAIVIGLMLAYLEQIPFWIVALQVGAGEFVVTTLPFVLFGKKLLDNRNVSQIFS